MAADYLEAFQELVQIMVRLRAPDGCPWDRAQTHASLRETFLEESWDLLLHIIFQAQIAAESGEFQIADVIRDISTKLRRRHPHVFGDATATDAAQVALNWDQLKKQERPPETSILGSVPPALPALNYSQSVQGRVARVGFDWDADEAVFEKLTEEVAEMGRAVDDAEWAAEFGDVLFTLVNVARRRGVSAEAALRQTNYKFYRRFTYIERTCRRSGREMEKMSLEETDELWEAAKRELG